MALLSFIVNFLKFVLVPLCNVPFKFAMLNETVVIGYFILPKDDCLFEV